MIVVSLPEQAARWGVAQKEDAFISPAHPEELSK